MCYFFQLTVASVDGVVSLPADVVYDDVVQIMFIVISDDSSIVEVSDLVVVGCMRTGQCLLMCVMCIMMSPSTVTFYIY